MKCYFAEIRDIKDPTMSGRCKVRIYNNEDNEQEVKDEHLPWAVSLMPCTSASTNRVGTIPTGMIQGSRVVVMFLDEEEQYPIILGSFHRSSEPKNSQNQSDSNQDDKRSVGENAIDVALPCQGKNAPEKGASSHLNTAVNKNPTVTNPIDA
jgi:hypothetical protein